jgi:hypothetical protein
MTKLLEKAIAAMRQPSGDLLAGDQPCARRARTTWRSSGMRSSLEPFQRRARVCSWA